MNEQYLKIKARCRFTRQLGPGLRYAVWLEERVAGNRQAVTDLLTDIQCHRAKLRGVTILGDEPFRQAEPLAELGRSLEAIGLTLMVYTRIALRDLRSMAADDRWINRALLHIDLLVCGEYIDSLYQTKERWLSSSNQRLHQLSLREEIEAFSMEIPRGVEVRLVHEGGGLAIEELSSSSIDQPRRHPLTRGSFQLSLSQINGQRWLDDLFVREFPTVKPDTTWQLDHSYWAYALDRSRKRCLKWVIDRSAEYTYPMIHDEVLVEAHPLDRAIECYPLHFSSASSQLLSGPVALGESIKSMMVAHQREGVSISRAFIDQLQKPCLGDWVLIASVYDKLTQPQVLVWLCEEVLNRHRKDRVSVNTWLMLRSPLVAFFSPINLAPLLSEMSEAEWAQCRHMTITAVSIITPSLPKRWAGSTYISPSRDQLFDEDTWRHLEAISALNTWAAKCQFFELGETCLFTIDQVLKEIEPVTYFDIEAGHMHTVRTERGRRMLIVNLLEPWGSIAQEASQSRYGDDHFMRAQLTLRFMNRWKTAAKRLGRFVTFGDSYVDR